MTLNPVKYSSNSENIVMAYNAELNKDPEYWSHEDVTPVRAEIKKHYIQEQKFMCCYCGFLYASSHGLVWDVEHVVPKSIHPDFMFTESNLAVACKDCNLHKSSKETMVDQTATEYPSSGVDFLVVHPHFDEWSNHILRVNNTYASRTPKGSWTIKECNLSRFAARKIGLMQPISDERFLGPVTQLLNDRFDAADLQQIVDELKGSLPPEITNNSTDPTV